MSANLVVLVVEDTSPVVRFVHVIASLDDPSMPRHALIGGLAVMCRLASAHRPTADVDTLARDDAVPTAVEVLVARGARRTSTGVELSGVKVDIIEVGVEDAPRRAIAARSQGDRSRSVGPCGSGSWARSS